ncbi:hypothetical protein [Streptomyces otsuchiensis]|uniref:hypothetical protein n=1 Tax=Streptomyces otsuchiensis TaxID=2681388 RepID=UPI00102FF3AA|nr:hypothetical protein [Streptomyces otsuchiensis]
MASSKVRTNVARLAAGAIFAAGASLAVAGVAQADGGVPCEHDPTQTCEEEPDPTDPSDPSDPTEPDPSDPADPSDPSNPDPTEPDPTEPDPSNPDPTEPDPTEPDPSNPDPTEPDPSNPDPTDPDPSNPDPTDPDPSTPPSSAPQSAGATEGIEAPEADEDLTEEETVDQVATGNGGELAETGAGGGEMMLLIGAATMVAGGVAFRYLPKALSKGGAAA